MNRIKFITNCISSHSISYNYDRVPEEIKTSEKPYVEIGCPDCSKYWKVRYDQFQKGSDCPCHITGRKLKTDNLDLIKTLHPELDFSKSVYLGADKNIKFNCLIHGEQELSVQSLLKETSGCPICKRNEQKLSKEELIQKLDFEKYNYILDKDFYVNDDVLKIHCKTCNTNFEQKVRIHLSSKIGCPKCATEYRAELKSVSFEELKKRTEEKFPNKYVLYEDKYKNLTTDTTIFCKTCNKDFQIKPIDFLESNIGCQTCAAIEGARKRALSQEEVNNRLLKLCGDNYTFENFVYKNRDTVVTLFCKKHNINFKQSCMTINVNGICCPLCSENSKGENKILKYLIENGYKENIDFKYDKPIKELIDGGQLRPDFLFNNLKIMIEYNGIQHEKYVPFLHNYNIHNFHKQKHHDWLKRKWCKKNDYKYAVIWYNEELIERLKSILK